MDTGKALSGPLVPEGSEAPQAPENARPAAVRELMIGSRSALSTGELAVVVESNPDPEHIHQPKVRIVADNARQTAPARLADLSHPDHKGRAIRHCVDPEKYGINSSCYVL